VKDASVYSWHYSPSRNFFCLTSKNEKYTHFMESESSRLRQQWITGLHKHGASIIQPSMYDGSGGYVKQRKGFLKIYHVGKKTNEGVCHPELSQLLDLVNDHIDKRITVTEAPMIYKEIKSLKKKISETNLEEQLAKENASSAVNQMEEARRMKQQLETSIEQTHEKHKGSRIKGTALLAYREMDQLKQQREIARLKELAAENKKKLVPKERKWNQLKKRVSELESQQDLVLQQTGKSVKKNVRKQKSNSNDMSDRDRSWSTLLLGDSTSQNESNQLQDTIGQDSVMKITELTDTSNKQSIQLEELRVTQQEMNEHMSLLEQQKEELKQAFSEPYVQHNDSILATEAGGWEDSLSSQYDTTDTSCRQLKEKIDALTKDYQKLEKFTEQMTGELNEEISLLKNNCEDVESSLGLMEASAEQIINDLSEEKDNLLRQLEQQPEVSDKSAFVTTTRSSARHRKTTTIGMCSKELKTLREEHIRLKTCLQMGGEDVNKAEEKNQREKEEYAKVLQDLKELKAEKYVLLEDMLKQREKMDVLDEKMIKRNTRIAELEQDNATLESKLVHLVGTPEE